ncbi:tail fiber domain-containing protein [Limosilactobacillus fermentum]|uniref:tail fiber domain-containing protein n=1 Tax=Limosilactobacillus fermentum TaxID=1613 RepID=UPI003EBDE046
MVQTLNFINLSSQQAPNDVDWAGLVNSGVQGVLIRLGHGIIRDPCASGHIAKAKQYGLYWHGYHTYEGVVNEPQFTIKNANELGLSTSQYYFVDLTKSSDPFNDYYALHANWLSQGYSTGLLISSNDYLSKFTDSDVTASGTLRWLISDTKPADYDVWQYSSEGTIGTSSVKVGFNFAKTDKLKYNLNTTLTGADISKDPYNPQAPVGGAYIGWGYDTTGLGGGKTIGYSTNGKNFYALIGPDGLVVRKSDGNRIYGTIADQIDSAISANVIPAKSAADSAVAYANDAVEKSKVNSQAIDDINSAVSDAVSDAAVARSDGLRAWNAAQSNVNLIDLNYASASAAISSARTEAIAAADEAKSSASVAQAGVVAVKSDVAAVQADVTATRSEVEVAKSDIADTKATLAQTASDLNSKITGVETSLADTTSALSDAKTAFSSGVAEAKELAITAQTTANSAVESAGENAKALTSQANALSDAKKAIDSDVASAKGLANAAQVTADNAIKSASSVANDLSVVASQAKANANGITKVTSDVGLLQTTVANNTGDISTIQETAKQIQQSVSDNAGNITVAKQTADSAVAVASDAKSNATVAVQTASGASVTSKNAQGDATTAMTTANSAVIQASDAKSNATIAVQTASEASLTATNAQGDASIAKQTASDASVQIKNAQGDISKLQTRAGAIETSVANNSGAIADVQTTANQLKASVSDNAGNITVAKQTADSAVAVASDAKSNATVAIQTASQASVTAQNASGQAASAVLTANGAMTAASDAKSNATVAVQTASGASLTATNANSDATVAKQTASEAIFQASNAESNFAQLSIRANKIEANVADNSGAIASVQQTANGLTTTVAAIKANGGGVNLAKGTSSEDQSVGDASQTTGWVRSTIATFDNPQAGQQYTISVNTRYNGGSWKIQFWDGTSPTQRGKWIISGNSFTSTQGQKQTATITWPSGSNKYMLVQLANNKKGGQIFWNSAMLEEGAVAHTWSPAPEDLQNQFTQIKQSINGVTTIINDPKTGLNATYQTAAGNSTTISNIQGDVSQLKVSASSASVALSDAAGNISSLQATASELETKYADAAGDISTLQANAKGMTQTISDAQGDIAKLKTRADGFDTQFANINGDINKIQTNATGVTQTLANTKSDVAVLQSRADGFDAKYATAAGDINTLKTNASGFSQTLTNSQGDISTLKSTVSGVQTTLTDAQGNISTLQSDVSGLKKTTSDNAGNISTLQATAKTLTSQMSGAQGDISTLKQTASDFSSKVSGMETSLSDANSKINGITSNGGGRNLLQGTGTASGDVAGGNGTFAQGAFNGYDAVKTNGCWSEHYLDLKSALGRTNAKAGDWYTISVYVKADKQIDTGSLDVYRALGNVDANTNDGHLDPILMSNKPITTQWQQYSWSFQINNVSLQRQRTRVEYNFGTGDNWIYWAGWMLENGTVSHDWSPAPEDTDAKITANTTAIEQNKQAIALKADQTTVDKTNGTVQQLQSQLKVQAGQIQEKVTSSQVTGMLAGYATQDYTQSLVTQKADDWNVNLTKLKNDTQTSLTNLAIGVEGVQAQVYNSDGSSKITQLSSLIATKVSQGDYNSQITQLKNDINLRVKSADLISQINLQAGTALIQSNKLVLDAKTTVFTGDAFIPSAAISSISADKIMLGSSALYNSDGTLNLVNQSNNLKALIQVKQGLVQNTTQSIISFSSDYNNRAFSITPVGATVTPTLFFERYDQTAGHWLGFSRNEVQREGLTFNTWDNDGERFFVSCHARFDRNISADGTINQGTWNGTSGKPEAGILTIKSGNTIWSGSDYLAVGDHVNNSYTNVIAKSFSQQSTLSAKTNIQPVDPKDALDLINKTDILSYQYKSDVANGSTKRYTSLIIDDVNDVSEYFAPDEFTNESRTGRDDGSAVGYLFLAVKELTRRIKTLEEKLNG